MSLTIETSGSDINASDTEIGEGETMKRPTLSGALAAEIAKVNAAEIARMKADPDGYEAEIAAEVAQMQHVEDCKRRNVCPKCEVPLPHLGADGQEVHPWQWHRKARR